ncbi:hypothetical protein H5410_034709 [Solanum commersonii]|uniref:Uncharacterized protein n=1 Tax=Solanum commersonii TaxID=4109 RepID=A0A9J5YRF1_SOLCO|nr:hypothetical protein H5410_034709 [Solanum commersonii]
MHLNFTITVLVSKSLKPLVREKHGFFSLVKVRVSVCRRIHSQFNLKRRRFGAAGVDSFGEIWK